MGKLGVPRLRESGFEEKKKFTGGTTRKRPAIGVFFVQIFGRGKNHRLQTSWKGKAYGRKRANEEKKHKSSNPTNLGGSSLPPRKSGRDVLKKGPRSEGLKKDGSNRKKKGNAPNHRNRDSRPSR